MMTIPVFYSGRMNANVDSLSPSAAKPALVVASWLEKQFQIELIEPRAVADSDIKLVHDPAYVDAIFSGKTRNAFGNNSLEVAHTFPFTVGSMLDAAMRALDNGKVAVAPCSGFHHASYGVGRGFCTFNGLMITAMKLKQVGRIDRIGILDFDMHYGDGTAQLIEQHHAADWIEHYTAGREYQSRYQATEFLERIPEMVSEMRDCDLILYQAGADPHVNDPLGGFLTTEQLQLRDRLVFATAKKLAVPIAWNLAGGYQEDASGGIRPVLDIHDNTMLECVWVYASGL
ncbi:MAG TPA: hypothetical protein VFP33_02395 [Gallionella sp.]|nr:hypothetical protein [Gallionella sp.]